MLATGRFTISSSPDSFTCSVHLPCGRYAGSLPLARLDLLHTAYLAHGNQDKGFEEAMAQLLMRKRPKETGKSPTCRLPAALVAALQRGLRLDTELLASCLTFDSGMRSYCSTEPGDEQFGANPEAYTGTAAWAGRTLCVPHQDSASTLMPFGWSGHPSPGPRDCHAVKASIFFLFFSFLFFSLPAHSRLCSRQ